MNYTRHFDCGCKIVVIGVITDATIIYCPKHSACDDMYEELKKADVVICQLCKRLNPQHAQTLYHDSCESCEEREVRLKALAKVERA